MLPERKGFPMKRTKTIPFCAAALGCAALMTGCGETHPAQNAEYSRTATARTTVTRMAETTTAPRTSDAPAETTLHGVTTDANNRTGIIDRAESKAKDAASDVQSAVTSVLTEATREVHPFDGE